MAFDKFLDKAKNLANDPKVKDKLNSDKAEKVTDSVLDKAAGVADSLTGGKHSDKINKARDAADDAIGNDRGQNGGTDRGDDQAGGANRDDNGFDGDNGPAGNR
ncbi:antitoxin [Brevibacterium epidermidis]|uniref:antitoxin n=1 Tax=Brevibacterium epidermidis TaxID=1698 RepID=UPI0009F9DD6B|nr:antitoxin [Brevibacterium epidermidis]